MGSNLTKNQEFIAKKYEKARRMKLASFKVGDTASFIIPKRYRHATNQRKAPCAQSSFPEHRRINELIAQ